MRKAQSVRGIPPPSLLQRGLQEGAMIALGALGLYLFISLVSFDPTDPGWTNTGASGAVRNAGGTAGAWSADILFLLFGYMSYLLPLTLLYRSWLLVRDHGLQWPPRWGMLGLRIGGALLVLAAGGGLAAAHFHGVGMPAGAGGILGSTCATSGTLAFGQQGVTLLFIATLLLGITLFTNISWLRVMDRTGELTLAFWARSLEWSSLQYSMWRERREARKIVRARKAVLDRDTEKRAQRKAPKIAPVVAEVKTSPRVEKERQRSLFQQGLGGDTLPRLKLLDPVDDTHRRGYSKDALEALSRLVEIKLAEYGVTVEVMAVQPGPVVTRFEVQPAAGVKASQISNLARDLARSMAVLSVRVVEVIPGKSTVGIEIPNQDREIVRLSEILSSGEYDAASSPLTIALGKDIAGVPVVADLARMPHLLVAGTTGSGKSVGLNAMLLSLLFKSVPEEVRLIMIDPKMVELSVYNGIPHLLAPVVTDMKDAGNALRWCVFEMERRYLLMNHLKVRNLAGYNRKLAEAEKAGEPVPDPTWKSAEAAEAEAPTLEHLPQIVVVVDEFADLLISLGDKGKKIEELIARIAQKARAAGIHMILATQRPDSKVITGLIKANVPSRIAFQVAEKVQSRIILDQGGAEQLLGQGDMLYLPPGKAVTERVHGAFVSDEEVHRVVEDLRSRGEPQYLDEITAGPEGGDMADGFGGEEFGSSDSESDPLYDEAVAHVMRSRRASISAVQRQLRVGYNRSARILEAMEKAGLVSEMGHNGQREVLVPARDDS